MGTPKNWWPPPPPLPTFPAIPGKAVPSSSPPTLPNFIDNEVVAGPVGSVWTLAKVPAATPQVFQQLVDFGLVPLELGVNYTIAGANITITSGAGGVVPTAGQVRAWYRW